MIEAIICGVVLHMTWQVMKAVFTSPPKPARVAMQAAPVDRGETPISAANQLLSNKDPVTVAIEFFVKNGYERKKAEKLVRQTYAGMIPGGESRELIIKSLRNVKPEKDKSTKPSNDN